MYRRQTQSIKGKKTTNGEEGAIREIVTTPEAHRAPDINLRIDTKAINTINTISITGDISQGKGLVKGPGINRMKESEITPMIGTRRDTRNLTIDIKAAVDFIKIILP